MIRIVTAASVAALLAAQPALAQDTVSTGAPATSAPAPAKHMSFAEKLAIAAGVVGAGVVAVKALKSKGQDASSPQSPTGQPTVQ